METISLDWDKLEALSYQTKFPKNLKNTLRKFSKDELFAEINDMIFHFTENESKIPYDHRIKSLQSCTLKYKKYYPSTETEKVFNDILGIRIIVNSYSVVDDMSLSFPEQVKVADMRNGKAQDDGYRGIHLYYQKDHWHYPIEVQFMTSFDRQFNEWLHIFLYKYKKDNSAGVALRKAYDEGIISSEEDFRKEMQHVLSNRQKF